MFPDRTDTRNLCRNRTSPRGFRLCLIVRGDLIMSYKQVAFH